MAKSGKMNLEIQHNGVNITSEALMTLGRNVLKEQKIVLSHYDIQFFYVPAHQTLYYELTSLKGEETLTGKIVLEKQALATA